MTDPRGSLAEALEEAGIARGELVEELWRQSQAHARSRGAGGQLRYWTRTYAWIAVVGGATVLKRLLDVTVAAVMLVALAPLFAIVAMLITATDGGPVLFWQVRVGRWGREFPFPKFRSMVPDAEAMRPKLALLNQHGESITFKIRRDPRVTWIGRILRKTSIDELPQLWCVLKGEMSLVGPRPPLPSEVARYSLGDRRRLDVTPGLTCLWQVSGRGDLPFPRQVALDVQYIESRSLWLDLKILVKTIPAVLLGKGAY